MAVLQSGCPRGRGARRRLRAGRGDRLGELAREQEGEADSESERHHIAKYWDYVTNPLTWDDQVCAHVIQITPRISGPLDSLPIKDNQLVKTGDLLFEIDLRTFKSAVDRATFPWMHRSEIREAAFDYWDAPAVSLLNPVNTAALDCLIRIHPDRVASRPGFRGARAAQERRRQSNVNVSRPAALRSKVKVVLQPVFRFAAPMSASAKSALPCR